MKKQSILPLEEVFNEYDLRIQGITWDNVSTIGDINIQQLYNIIAKNTYKKLDEIDNTITLPPIAVSNTLRQEAGVYAKAIAKFTTVYKTNRNAVLKKLQKAKKGITKPLIPLLRTQFIYPKRSHVVLFNLPGMRHDPKRKEKWIHMAVRYVGEEDCTFVPLKAFDDKTGVHKGYYATLYFRSCAYMSPEELVWFRKTKDVEFVKLWLRNSNEGLGAGRCDMETFSKMIQKPYLPLKDFKASFRKLSTNLLRLTKSKGKERSPNEVNFVMYVENFLEQKKQ